MKMANFNAIFIAFAIIAAVSSYVETLPVSNNDNNAIINDGIDDTENLAPFSRSVREPFPHSFHIRFLQHAGGSCEVLSEGLAPRSRIAENSASGISIKRHPRIISEDNEEMNKNGGEIVTIKAKETNVAAVVAALMEECTQVKYSNETINTDQFYRSKASSAGLKKNENVADVYEIIISGDPANRIDSVLMGDAYTTQLVGEFLDDMTRMTNDMFNDVTFASYLPVFNIWAVFSPSVADQIGVNGDPENTRYRLYRDGTELRGIYTDAPNNARVDCTSTGPDACDFPSLIGRDEYYGGLGGEFTISTRSHTSGTKVLRHEQGHNYASVGEEYEGGSSYFGANFSPNLNVGWRHWLTDAQYPPPAQQDDLIAQDYAWYDLSDGPYTIRMSSDGSFARRSMRFTVSGCAEADSLIITLDGQRLNWTTVGVMDRSFYEYYWPTGFTAGNHVLVFSISSNPAPGNPIRQLCSLTYQEYRAEGNGYTFDNTFIGAFPVRRQNGQQAGYRPNHEQCLMRNMTSRQFCVVCQETIWHQFLDVMDWIDDIVVTTASGNTSVQLLAVKVGQLRETPLDGVEERYIVTWTRNNVAQPNLNDSFDWTLPTSQATGTWRVTITYETSEVRDDPNGLLTTTATFNI